MDTIHICTMLVQPVCVGQNATIVVNHCVCWTYGLFVRPAILLARILLLEFVPLRFSGLVFDFGTRCLGVKRPDAIVVCNKLCYN